MNMLKLSLNFIAMLISVSYVYSDTTKVELCNSSSYDNATIKVEQTIISVSDTMIYFDFNKGDLTSGEAWLFITNDDGFTNLERFKIYINAEPVAVNDQASTNEDNLVIINVISNDTDVDGTIDRTSVTVTQQSGNGTLTNHNDGTITYAPNLNFNGDDTFKYTVKDNLGTVSNEATVRVTINSINDAPLAINDQSSTNEDYPVIINVISNDTDMDGIIDSSSVMITHQPQNGILVNHKNGTLTYTPNVNYNGADIFKYTVKDDDNAMSDEANVSLTINSVNDEPGNFKRLLPLDDSVIQSDSITFVWSKAADVDGDTLMYTLSTTIEDVYSDFILQDTLIIIDDLKSFNLPQYQHIVNWTVTVSDGILTSEPINGSGRFYLSFTANVNDPDTGLPTEFALNPNFPNPFNPTTLIRYQLPETAKVKLLIFNIQGHLVRTLVNEEQKIGYYDVRWDGLNNSGFMVSSGIYLYCLQAYSSGDQKFLATRKMFLIK